MSATPAALVLLNPGARGGRGRELWARIAREAPGAAAWEVAETAPDGLPLEALRSALERGVRFFVAAGGDGTVGALADGLVRLEGGRRLGEIVLGAVGLGSSNDFHKPVGETIAGIPVRLDVSTAAERDVGVVRLAGEATRHFLVSASAGVTAEANAFFNRGDAVLRRLKPRSTSAAILYAAVRTIATYRNIPVRIGVAGEARESALTNLSVLKTPYLSGSFRFDTPVEPADGRFAVNLCEGLSRRGLLRLLFDLSRGRFLGGAGRRHWRSASVSISSAAPVAIEVDGEVLLAREATFEIAGRLRVSGPGAPAAKPGRWAG